MWIRNSQENMRGRLSVAHLGENGSKLPWKAIRKTIVNWGFLYKFMKCFSCKGISMPNSKSQILSKKVLLRIFSWQYSTIATTHATVPQIVNNIYSWTKRKLIRYFGQLKKELNKFLEPLALIVNLLQFSTVVGKI